MSEIKNEVSIPMGKTAFILWSEIDAAVNRWAKDYFGPHVYAEGTHENEDFEVSLRGLTSSDYEKFSQLFKRYDLEQDYDPEYEFETGDVTCTLPCNVSRGAVLEALPGEAVRAIGTAIAVYDGVFFMEHSIDGKTAERFVAPSQKGHAATSLPEQPQPAASRLNLLSNYKENAEVLARAEADKKQNENETVIGQIKSLKPRIEELIATGNACLGAAIPIDDLHNRGKYSEHAFCADSIHHKLGFASIGSHLNGSITHLGVNGGGACGAYNLRTDGISVLFVHEDNPSLFLGEPSAAGAWLMRRFLEDFNEFESSFYGYVDQLIAKQQSSIDKLNSPAPRSALSDQIQSASNRASAAKAHKPKAPEPER